MTTAGRCHESLQYLAMPHDMTDGAVTAGQSTTAVGRIGAKMYEDGGEVYKACWNKSNYESQTMSSRDISLVLFLLATTVSSVKTPEASPAAGHPRDTRAVHEAMRGGDGYTSIIATGAKETESAPVQGKHGGFGLRLPTDVPEDTLSFLKKQIGGKYPVVAPCIEKALCAAITTGSKSHGQWSCQCDDHCRAFRDCCVDIDDVQLPNTTSSPPAIIHPDSCRWRCGRTALFGRVTCGCDVSCETTNTCCDDYRDVCVTGSVRSSRQDDQEPLQCGHAPNATDHYWMVASCPEGYPTSRVRTLCETPGNSTDDVLLEAPVVENVTGVPYRNMFCGICNGAEQMVTWETLVLCPPGLDETRVRTNLSGVLSEGLCTRQAFSPSSNLPARRCFPPLQPEPSLRSSSMCDETECRRLTAMSYPYVVLNVLSLFSVFVFFWSLAKERKRSQPSMVAKISLLVALLLVMGSQILGDVSSSPVMCKASAVGKLLFSLVALLTVTLAMRYIMPPSGNATLSKGTVAAHVACPWVLAALAVAILVVLDLWDGWVNFVMEYDSSNCWLSNSDQAVVFLGLPMTLLTPVSCYFLTAGCVALRRSPSFLQFFCFVEGLLMVVLTSGVLTVGVLTVTHGSTSLRKAYQFSSACLPGALAFVFLAVNKVKVDPKDTTVPAIDLKSEMPDGNKATVFSIWKSPLPYFMYN
ncbi:Hypp3033 [Branchiostoma lanceolatum]|uniref:Hypp3033 protein n=1 Tax=Branchiostoma lanceolatum TaxID=7740 RepID=A0A8J9ZYH3_BRALA|nr:Hypp3033 [Branchiostoma lanceolatum]